LTDPLNLVFDLDGTLIDSAPQIHAAANMVFQAKGLQPFSQATVRGFIGNGVGVLVSRLMTHQGLGEDPALQAALVAEFVSIYEEAFDLTKLYSGVFTALSDLEKAGHRLAICTNKPVGPTRAVLRHFGLTDRFPVVIGGDSLPQRKPDPAPLWAALVALGPGKALFIGDSEVDAATANAAGVPLGLYTGGYRAAAVESLGAKLVFDDHAALPGLVTHLSPRL
jgi:phosphoglycolate phosphatase